MSKELIRIVQSNEPVLRELAQTVPTKDITSDKIQNIIKSMRIALSTQNDGVAIAAPQIGIPL
jgi:peptide deformylase